MYVRVYTFTHFLWPPLVYAAKMFRSEHDCAYIHTDTNVYMHTYINASSLTKSPTYIFLYFANNFLL